MKIASENLEFKSQISASLVKEIIAFCNTNGGTMSIYNKNGGIS